MAKQHIAEMYGPRWHVFSVWGKGGISLGGERYSGRNYRVDLDKVECSCNVSQVMHATCSHKIMACRVHRYDFEGLPYMSPLYLHLNTLSIWERIFEPYLDPTQWPPYHGYDYMPHPDLMKVGKGRRKKKRLKGDMDAMRGYDGGDFNETRGRNLCSVCKQSVHKASRHRRRGQTISYCVRIA